MESLFNSQLQELELAMKPYQKDWDNWTKSSGCFLEQEEINAVNWYLITRSYENGAKEANLSETRFIIAIKDAISKLNLFLETFKNHYDHKKTEK
jgi:hypothetical protein